MKFIANMSVMVTAQIEVEGDDDSGYFMQPQGVQIVGNMFSAQVVQVPKTLQTMLMTTALNNAAQKMHADAIAQGAEMVAVGKTNSDSDPEDDDEPKLN